MLVKTLVAAVVVELGDLLTGVLILAGSAALIALTVVFIKLAKVLTNLDKVISIASVDVNSALKHLPEVTESLPGVVAKLDSTLSDVNKITGTVSNSLPEVLDDVTNTTGVVGDTAKLVRRGVGAIGRGAENLALSLSERKPRNNTFGDVAHLLGVAYGIRKNLKKSPLFSKKKKKGLF